MNPLNHLPQASHKSLQAHQRRSERKLSVSRAAHAGIELSRLDKEERAAMRCWAAGEDLPAGERAEAYSKLGRVLDTLRDRRRILLGEPLPGSRRAGTERRPVLPVSIVEVQPVELPAPAPMISDAEPSVGTQG